MSARPALVLALATGIALAASADGRAAPREEAPIRIALTGTPRPAPPPPAPAPADSFETRFASSPTLAIAKLDRRIADLDAEEQSFKKELSEIGGKIAAAHERSLIRGRAFYRLTRAGMLPVGGGFTALVSHALRVERARRVLAADLAAEKHLRARGAELSRGIERLARERVTFSKRRRELNDQRIASADESRRQRAFDRAFSTSSAPSDYVAVYGGKGAAEDGVAAGFAAARGRLLFPLAGRAEVRPAHREGAAGPGLEIKSTLGAPVRAVFAGRVAFSDRYGPYGRLVILDHGDHYYTVSGNLAGVDVKVGDQVSAGQRLGTVGDDGKGPMLYFEIRHGTDTLAPSPWLGI